MFELLDIDKKCNFEKVANECLKELDMAKDGKISKSMLIIVSFLFIYYAKIFNNLLLILTI